MILRVLDGWESSHTAKGQKPLINGAGFCKTKTRGFDGVVRERMK